MDFDVIKGKPIIIGIFIVLAFYVVSNIISGLNISLIDILLAGLAVGFMVGGSVKDSAINGAIFGVIGGVILTLILLLMYSLAGYSSIIGLLVKPNNILDYRNNHFNSWRSFRISN